MYATTVYYWNDIIAAVDDIVVPAADSGTPIMTSAVVEAKPNMDYG